MIFGGVLEFLTLKRRCPWVGCRLFLFGMNVLEFGEIFGYIIGHESFDITSIVIPIDVKAEVAGASPTDGQ